jgi:isocitrate/isopropylmalate dehydrogenase
VLLHRREMLTPDMGGNGRTRELGDAIIAAL